MTINIFGLLSSLVLLLIVLFIFLKLKQKEKYANKQEMINCIFAICLGLVGVYSCLFGFLLLNNKTYSMIFIVAMVAGILFDIKRISIVVIIELVCLLLQPDFADMREMLNVDIISLILSAALGHVCKIILYKDVWPSILGSIMMSMILTTLYMIVVTFSNAFNIRANIYDIANETLIIKTVQNGISIVIIFVFLNIFFKQQNESVQNGILYKFLKKYNILLLVATIILSILTFGFYYMYIINITANTIRLNYNIGKDIDLTLKENFGDDYFDTSEYAKSVFENWIVGEGGAVFMLDKDGNVANKLAKEIITYYRYDEILPKQIKGLEKYPDNRIIYFDAGNYKLLAMYFQTGKYKFFAFMPFVFMFNKAYYAAYITSYAITLIAISMFILTYILFKNIILDKIVSANKKLKMISDGNYDIVLNDTTTTEVSELADSINKTVGTLKANIKEIEEKNREELELARKIQSAQLSTPDDYTAGGLIYADNIPAEDVGGDFYDIINLDGKKKVFIVADVSGKGIPAAMFMMKAKNTIINFAKQNLDIDKVMEYTNNALCVNNDALMFVTCFVIFANMETGTVKYVNAGHNQPIFCKKVEDGYECQYIDTKSNMMLGIQPNIIYDVNTIRFSPNDAIFLYTDGVTEARNVNKEFYGEERLLSDISSYKNIVPKELCKDIIKSVEDFSNGAKQHDDITLLCYKFNGYNNTLVMNATEEDFEKGKILMRRFFELYNIDTDIASNLKIVYDEMYSNIMRHAYDNKGGELIYELNLINKNVIEMVFKDKGEEFNPVTFDNDDKSRKAEDKINGGMGIMFCKNIMDKCEYKRENGYNVLKLYKKVFYK